MAGEKGALNSSKTICLSDEEASKEVVARSIFHLWDAVNELTRLRGTKRERYRVTIFGSARAKPGSFVYEEVKRVAAVLGEMGCDIVTGGGPGLMQAANEGAQSVNAEERHKSVGIRVQLPFEQEVNPFVAEAFEHKSFFTRLHQFVIMSDAFVVVPGGVGTVLELMMVWQLLQVKHVEGAPLILVGPMWKGLVEWARGSLCRPDFPLANVEDMAIPQCVDTGDEAVAILRAHHAAWVGVGRDERVDGRW